MTKSIFEELGGTYTQQGDYLLPDLKLPETEQKPMAWVRKMNSIRSHAMEITSRRVMCL